MTAETQITAATQNAAESERGERTELIGKVTSAKMEKTIVVEVIRLVNPGPHTVDTLPPATLTAFNDHGTVALTLRDDLAA